PSFRRRSEDGKTSPRSMTEDTVAADALVESLRTLHQDDPAPVYVQIARRIRMGVADGTLQPGDHLPSVRDLAKKLGLSPNTVGRAYADLSREGVIKRSEERRVGIV